MITTEANERLTRVGPGTAMGNLLRYYWQPIAPVAKLDEHPVQKIRILCENLVLFRDRSGGMGLISDTCAHRSVNMAFGIPEAHGLRCPYHGWCYDKTGQCIETPLEPANSPMKDNIKIAGYPVEELGGLVWAYLGPLPAPILPRWDYLVVPNSIRQIAVVELECDWLQCHENSADPYHGDFFQYQPDKLGLQDDRPLDSFVTWDSYVIFPNSNSTRASDGSAIEANFAIAIDDTHTLQMLYRTSIAAEAEAEVQDVVPYFHVLINDENGAPLVHPVLVRDWLARASLGAISDGAKERLGAAALDVIEFRNVLEEQMQLVEQGKEPTINVFRDPAEVSHMIAPELKLDSDYQIKGSRRAWHRYHEWQ